MNNIKDIDKGHSAILTAFSTWMHTGQSKFQEVFTSLQVLYSRYSRWQCLFINSVLIIIFICTSLYTGLKTLHWFRIIRFNQAGTRHLSYCIYWDCGIIIQLAQLQVSPSYWINLMDAVESLWWLMRALACHWQTMS